MWTSFSNSLAGEAIQRGVQIARPVAVHRTGQSVYADASLGLAALIGASFSVVDLDLNQMQPARRQLLQHPASTWRMANSEYFRHRI